MPDASYEAVEQSGGQPKWRLLLLPDGLRLEPTSAGTTIEIPRSERPERVELHHGLFLKRMLGVTAGKAKKLFRLDEAGFAALRAWAGPPTTDDLRVALARRFGMSIVLGGIILLGALPQPGLPTDGVSLAMGGALLASGLMSRFMPSRVFFITDCLWVAVAVWNTVEAIAASPGPFNVLILLLQANYLRWSVQEFRRFAAMVPGDPARPPASPWKGLAIPVLVLAAFGGLWYYGRTAPSRHAADDLMSGLAKDAVAAAERDCRILLDGSVESLQKVDDVLARVDRKDPATVQGQALRFGAYVGEAIRGRHGWARWESQETGYALHWEGGISFPVDWCAQRILNGEEDSVWKKYAALAGVREPPRVIYEKPR